MVIIQPIRNQYLTALKERQHIIHKLNEIIRGLNALDFDDLTTIHTELVSIREALQTQNNTINDINDSIEQIESELTSFDNRLIGLNADISDTEAHLSEFENDTILNLQAKVNKNGDTMTGNLSIPTTATGVRNNLAINGERLQNDLDNYAPMLRTTGNFEKTGDLSLIDGLIGYMAKWLPTSTTMNVGQWCIFAEMDLISVGGFRIFEVIQGSNTSCCYGKFLIKNYLTDPLAIWIELKNKGSNNPLTENSIKILSDGNKQYLAWNKITGHGTLRIREYTALLYGSVRKYNNGIKWLNPEEMIVLDNLDNYTVSDVTV